MPVDCFCRCANRSKVFSPNEQREKSSRNRKKFHVPTDNYDTTRSMMVVKIYQRMSHRNLVARKTTFHSPRATPFSFLPRSKKNFSYRTMIVKFFSENEGQLATTENQLTSKRQSICEREIQSQFSTKNQRLTSFHTSNLRAFRRRVGKLATPSWDVKYLMLAIYIYIYYIHERILSHQSKHSISHFFPRRVLYNETAIVGIHAIRWPSSEKVDRGRMAQNGSSTEARRTKSFLADIIGFRSSHIRSPVCVNALRKIIARLQ